MEKQSWIYCRRQGCWNKRCEVDGQKLFWCSKGCRAKDDVWIGAPNCPKCGRKCSPSNWHATHFYALCGECVRKKAELPQDILFYGSSSPYYEFTNFYYCPQLITVTIGDITVSSHFSETLYQAAKIWFFECYHSREFWKVLQMSARDAFNHVRTLDLNAKHPDRAREFHGTEKISCMKMIVKAKFRDPKLKRLLISTRGHKLIENSPTDAFWGIGDGTGRNELGKILMRIRDKKD